MLPNWLPAAGSCQNCSHLATSLHLAGASTSKLIVAPGSNCYEDCAAEKQNTVYKAELRCMLLFSTIETEICFVLQ